MNYLHEKTHDTTKTTIAICAKLIRMGTHKKHKTAYIFVGEQIIEQKCSPSLPPTSSSTQTEKLQNNSHSSPLPSSSLPSSSSSSLPSNSLPSSSSNSSLPARETEISSFPPRLSEGIHFYSVNFSHLSSIQKNILPKWISQIKTELALSQMAQNHSILSILFRPIFSSHQTAGFYHSCKLSSPSVALLREEIEKKLNVEARNIYAIVRDENVLVECDEDLISGLRLDVYII